MLAIRKERTRKKIVLKEKPNRVVKRPYNLENKCEIAGKEEDVVILEEGKEIKRKKLELKCEGRNMVKTYKQIPCQPSTSASARENEEENSSEDVKKARKNKGIGKKSEKKTDVNNNSDGNNNANSNIDVAAIATNLANNMKELIRPDFRTTQLTLEVIALTRSIFEGCARIRLPKSERKKRFGCTANIYSQFTAVIPSKGGTVPPMTVHCRWR